MAQKKFSDLSKIAELEKTDILAIERTDGTKQASFKQLCNAIAVQQIEELIEELPEIKEDDNLSKIVGKINKWQKDALKKIEGLTGGVSGVDILDSQEEIEANTESGKAAGAQALKEMFDAINSNFGGCSFGITEDGQPGWKDGADTVHPFNDIMECAIITWGKTDASILISNGTFVVNSPNNQMNGRGRLLKIEGYSIIALTPCTVCNLSQVSQYAKPAFSKAAQNQVLATLTKDGAHCFIAF